MLHHKLIAGEIPGTYLVTELINEEDLLTIANQIARQKQAKGEAITDKHLAQQALQTLLQSREHEVFAMLFLDNQHRVLAYEELFHSTLSSASVYPREVVKRALALNAAALMLVHNHPSGHPEPSRAYIEITLRLQDALALVDIRPLEQLVFSTEGEIAGRTGRAVINLKPSTGWLVVILYCFAASSSTIRSDFKTLGIVYCCINGLPLCPLE